MLVPYFGHDESHLDHLLAACLDAYGNTTGR
jgi:hypothetical protein